MNFNGKDILSTFVKMEEEVAKYYSEMAEHASDKKSKKVFERLAKEEEKHQTIYSGLVAKFSDKMEREFPEDEIEYVKELMEENIKEKHQFDKNKKLVESLELAEKMEKDGILFVHQLMTMYPDLAEKELKIILKEEKKHLQLVRDRMKFAPTASLGL